MDEIRLIHLQKSNFRICSTSMIFKIHTSAPKSHEWIELSKHILQTMTWGFVWISSLRRYNFVFEYKNFYFMSKKSWKSCIFGLKSMWKIPRFCRNFFASHSGYMKVFALFPGLPWYLPKSPLSQPIQAALENIKK